jgi:DNA-directed RNA polymerase specialized sigma24 family protein
MANVTPPPTYAEVAAALDLPVGSIGPTRARCLQQLRRRLGSPTRYLTRCNTFI